MQIKLNSVNGGFRTSNAKTTAKTSNPAINLLPQKSQDDDDDDDWDDDQTTTRRSTSNKMNKDIDKAVKESQSRSCRVDD